RTYLLALAAADTGHVAGFLCHGTLVLVDAAHVDAARLGALLAQLDDILGAGFHTGSTGGALVFHHLGQHGLGVDMDGIERTGLLTVAQAQATEGTAGITTIERCGNGAVGGSIVEVQSGTLLAGATAAYYRYFFCCFGCRLSQDSCHAIHRLLSTHGTV